MKMNQTLTEEKLLLNETIKGLKDKANEFNIEEDGVTSFYNVPVKQVTSIPVKLFESKTTLYST